MPLTKAVIEKLQSVTDKPSGQKCHSINRNENQETEKIAAKVGVDKIFHPH
jgi:hypothetical protein